MSGIQTPFATQTTPHCGHPCRSSYDGASTPKEQHSNNAARQLSRGFTLDDTFNLPPCPSLDGFLMHALDNAAANATGNPLSRLLTMSTGKSLSAMASLDLSWLADFPAVPQDLKGRPASRAHSLARKPSLTEQLVGPEQLGSKELPAAPPLDTKHGQFKRPSSASGCLQIKEPPSTRKHASKKSNAKKNNSNKRQKSSTSDGVVRDFGSSSPTPTNTPTTSTTLSNTPINTVAAEAAAALQFQAAHASLLEAQAEYIKILELNNSTTTSLKTPPSLEQLEQIAAAQHRVAMQQANFGAALANAQQFSSTSSPLQQPHQLVVENVGGGAIGGGTFSQLQGLFPSYTTTTINMNLGSNGFLPSGLPTASIAAGTGAFAPKTPSESRMNALAQWEQERALMQALNSSDMETSVQACSGIINIAAGGGRGNFSLGSGGPISMPQPLPPPPSFNPHNNTPPFISMAPLGSMPPVTTGAPPVMSAAGGSDVNASLSHRRSGTPPLNLKIGSREVLPMVCVKHTQPIRVECTTSSGPSSPRGVDQ
jgi:hypothetical protein